MSQQSLFDNSPSSKDIYGNDKPLARKSDPATSHAAAASVAPKLRGKRKLFVDTLRLLLERNNYPRTAMEVAADAYPFVHDTLVAVVIQNRETLRKRAKELVRAGLICECESRHCKVNGNLATTYELMKGMK